MSPPKLRLSYHARIAPPLPSAAIETWLWSCAALQTATPLAVHSGTPVALRRCAKMSFEPKRGSAQATMMPPAPSETATTLDWLPVAVQTAVASVGSWVHTAPAAPGSSRDATRAARAAPTKRDTGAVRIGVSGEVWGGQDGHRVYLSGVSPPLPYAKNPPEMVQSIACPSFPT